MSGTTNIPLTALVPANAGPAVNSNGSYNGQCIGASVVLLADVNSQKLTNDLQVIYAQQAVMLANVQTAIQDMMSGYQNSLYQIWGIAGIEAIIRAGGDLSSDQQNALQQYGLELGADQSSIQAGVKGVDTVLTPTQQMPSAISTAANEEMTEAGYVLQGISFLANCKIQ